MLSWASGDFSEDEEVVSAYWRKQTRSLRIGSLQERLAAQRVILPKPTSEDEVVRVADGLLGEGGLQDVWFAWAADQFLESDEARLRAATLWSRQRHRGFSVVRPYSAHCLRCLLSLAVAIRHRFLGDQPTHLIDLQYLYYLPFCNVLASDDRVHRLLAPQLIRSNQDFVLGRDLKADLKLAIAERASLSEDARLRRAYALGDYPPPGVPVLHGLWKRHMRPWLGDKPSGNLIVELSDDDRMLAMEEARTIMGVN